MNGTLQQMLSCADRVLHRSRAMQSGLPIANPKGDLHIHDLYTNPSSPGLNLYGNVGGRNAFWSSQDHACLASKTLSGLCRAVPLDLPANHLSSLAGSSVTQLQKCHDLRWPGPSLPIYNPLYSKNRPHSRIMKICSRDLRERSAWEFNCVF
jgi:hypothetical protein